MSSAQTRPAVPKDKEVAYTIALVRALQHGGVRFLRYFTVDLFNNVRCKAVPLGHIIRNGGTLDDRASVAVVCYAGVPTYADTIVAASGLNAKNVLKIRPDPSTLRVLPYNDKSAIVLGTLHDQYTDELSSFCTRGLLQNVVDAAAAEHNIAFSVGVEIEFSLFDAVTRKPVDTSVFANSTTLNQQEDFVSMLYDQLTAQDIDVETVHAESGPGQLEVVLRYRNDPVRIADDVLLAKESIRCVARSLGMIALFLPKYDADKAGNGLHVHLSIRDVATGQSIFSQPGTRNLSPKGCSFLEGLLRHLPGILGVSLPTNNSFLRVGEGCWTGSDVSWAVEDKEVALRVCSDLATQELQHFECKLVDHTCNLYMTLTALLVAGIDGVDKQMELRAPHGVEAGQTAKETMPTTLPEALDALSADTLLTETFGPALMKAYLAVRRHEADRFRDMTLEEAVQNALSGP